jgi:acyl-CoA thioesterase-2
MSVSFHVEERAFDHQMKMPDVPKPEALATDSEIRENALPNIPESVRRFFLRERPIEFRPVELGRYTGERIEGGKFHIWIRCRERLPDDPAIHQCVLAYASDMALLDASLIPHGRSVFDKRIMAASLDHALWFHRPFRADEWMLYAQDSPSSFGARGFSRGLLFAEDGTLIASVAQEGMTRERRES